MHTLLVSVLLAATTAPLRHAFTVEDMLAMERVAEPALSPDGKWVAFTLRTTDLDANRGRTDLWLTSIDGAPPRRLTTHPDADTSARWSPDGKSLLFLSTRGGSSQVWRIAADGGEAEQVTKLPVDVAGFVPFSDGKRLLLALEVYPNAGTLEETAKRDEERGKQKVRARAYDTLLYRHWDQWEDGKRSHVFVWAPGATPIDLMKGMDTDSPPKPFGGMEEIALAPDGKSVVFAARVPGRDQAWANNLDLHEVASDGKSAPRAITADNKAEDGSPLFSPDGKTLAYLAMARPGYEADRRRVILLDRASGKRRTLTEAWDRSPSEIAWARDGKSLLAAADHLGHHAIFSIDLATGNTTPVADQGWNEHPSDAGDRIVFARDSLRSPVELYTVPRAGGEAKAITRVNAARVAAIDWGAAEQFTFAGAKGDKVHGFVVKPAGAMGKVPTVLIVHGGPQGSMGDHFHYRWNPMAYAGRGLGVVFIDFHGSTGYGQAFTDAIRGDWGGAPFEDLMKGLDAALAKYPWLDGSRTCAAGASYGGYMINWINGHTDRFKCLVVHDGNLDETMAYYDTEELWFPEWDHHGTPWDNPEGYAKQSPMAFVRQWKTPTLVVHGANDFRVVDTQGMSTFTALQRRGIPSRLLWFPDENHWVLKPLNSRRWHEEVLGWIDRWVRSK